MEMKIDAKVVEALTRKAIDEFVVAPRGYKVASMEESRQGYGMQDWTVRFEAIDDEPEEAPEVKLPLRPVNAGTGTIDHKAEDYPLPPDDPQF